MNDGKARTVSMPSWLGFTGGGPSAFAGSGSALSLFTGSGYQFSRVVPFVFVSFVGSRSSTWGSRETPGIWPDPMLLHWVAGLIVFQRRGPAGTVRNQ